MSVLDSTKISGDLIRSYWHPVAHKSELSNDRDFVRFDVADFEVVIINDKGSFVAFDNLCPHRGARFFTEDFGNKFVKCLYHGWSYSRGKVNVAGVKTFQGCNIEQASLNQFSLDICGDFLFFAIEPRSTLQEQLGSEISAILNKIGSDIDSRADFNRYPFKCDWTIALENALEPYHIPLIHTDTLASLQLGVGVNEFYGENSVWYSPIESEKVARRLKSLSRFYATTDAYEGYMSIFIFPFSMISSTFGYSYSAQNFFPSTSPDSTYFTSRLYPVRNSDPRYREMTAGFVQSSAEVNRRIFDEDHEICQRIPSKSWSTSAPKFISVLEEKLLHFRHSCGYWNR
ncbi:Rieske 2Fe-2S domain-containing protein [Pseudomonas fluorescens group sp.]|uniref:Rieske domain-containing protein n=2 Tax=Pseudomonas fluorescens TaxID=294 RepID=C3K726_PSEFS|nr:MULTISPECIES: Rieske 2Fe-2S domain-containing protein [Pseudomonas fluorescens group]MBZ6456752.1 Rieske 2Fe-2S domain-containing protein [Pseudomonas fluorescens group sp.]MBZ6461019.1 Rieske 2Fe-2S domain-containing protein [Pseudomonas fluorescens group sp.]MBZ6469121.1 Rieske 2Fe-2S domain-containing protein [Pseudomonas fluorescens group sp.]WQD73954.1 Rieske 2Fe-2S domain-containing protein [Pseudomonas marginalis]CAI2795945.1 Rieske domain-containing protein [Pseudomonas fluorescens 